MSTLAEIQKRLTITVPEAGQVLGLGRDAAYAAAERGEIPVRRFGRRLVVPVPALLALLGVTPDMREATAPPVAIPSTLTAAKESSHGQCKPDDAA